MKKTTNGFRQRVLCSSPAPIILSYIDGSWTDRLAGGRVALGVDGRAATLTIEVRPGARAEKGEVGDFLRKRHSIESVQITRRGLRKRLRALLHAAELPEFSVRLTAGGRVVVYPANAFFGPDAVTLNLG